MTTVTDKLNIIKYLLSKHLKMLNEWFDTDDKTLLHTVAKIRDTSVLNFLIMKDHAPEINFVVEDFYDHTARKCAVRDHDPQKVIRIYTHIRFEQQNELNDIDLIC